MNIIIIILAAICLIYIMKKYESLKIENFIANETEAVNLIKTIHKQPEIVVQNLTTSKCNLIPKGTIIMWHGTTNNIPIGWVLCDGQNGTPNTIDRYPLGALATDTNNNLPINASGRTMTIDASGITNYSGTHTHTVNSGSATLITSAGGTEKEYTSSVNSISCSTDGNHSHNASIAAVTKVDPLNVSVIFIMKLE